MSEIKPDDLFIINREGQDYKATVDQFAKDINIHVECGGSGGGSVHWDDIEGKPEVNDGQLNLNDPNGATKAEFSANQSGDTNVSVYLKDGYIQNLPPLTD